MHIQWEKCETLEVMLAKQSDDTKTVSQTAVWGYNRPVVQKTTS